MRSELTESFISKQLKTLAGNGVENPYPPDILKGTSRRAAIVVPFVKKDGEWHLIFIRRTINIHDHHSGQVAFPGGGIEPGEEALAAAMREAEEEIGIAQDKIKVIGRMGDFMAINNIIVTPFIGILPWPYPYSPDPREVSRIFTIPWNWLCAPENHRIETRIISPNPPFEVIYFKEYDGEILWGFSARIVLELITILQNHSG